MNRLVMVAAIAALFSGAGCASDADTRAPTTQLPPTHQAGPDSQPPPTPTAPQNSENQQQSRVYTTLDGATVIIHGEDAWVQERARSPSTEEMR